jgi:heterogeneous nuclear ribonucleoprotein F/H
MKQDAGYRGVLRMRGLPYTATADQVLEFFGKPATLAQGHVHMLRRADGRASGDAYVVFDSEEAAHHSIAWRSVA